MYNIQRVMVCGRLIYPINLIFRLIVVSRRINSISTRCRKISHDSGKKN